MKGCLLLSGLLVTVALQIHAARLVAYYPLDGDLADKSGNDYDLRDSHPEDGRWTADRDENKNCAAQFNGERGHYLACDHSWAVTGNTTVAFWFKPKEPLHVASTISEDSTYMMFPVYGGSVNDDVVGIGVAGGTDGIAVREHKSQYLQTTFLYKKSLGTAWHHFAICTAKDNAAVYLDGVKLGLADANGFRKKISNGCSIGGGSYGSFNGCVDDVRYYDGTLNDLEVADLARRVRISDVSVFSGHPWKEVVIGYTITGTATETDIISLTATDKSANKTYTARSLAGAELTEGRHVLRWNAAAEGIKFSSSKVVFSVTIVRLGGVQLWANGPYWAECNVGASRPEEYGYYFWWGDTEGCRRNASNDGWVSVKNGAAYGFYENCPTYGKTKAELQSAGYINATGNLVAAHDAATAHLGAPWRLPTIAEFSALESNCDTEWTSRNGVSGRLVKGRGAYASKSIFLPAAGCGVGIYYHDFNLKGYYWSSTPYSGYSENAWYLHFDSSHLDEESGYESKWGRDYGRSVRPVREFAK